jgi:hypothetical protein
VYDAILKNKKYLYQKNCLGIGPTIWTFSKGSQLKLLISDEVSSFGLFWHCANGNNRLCPNKYPPLQILE